MRPVDKVLDRARGIREAGTGYLVSCPLADHGQGRGDRNPSVSVSEGDDGRALVSCQTGCETADVVAMWGLKMADLFESRNGHGGGGSYTSSKTTSTGQPATLENYAAYVELPVEYLKSLSLEQYYRLGKPAVRMPYLDEAGEECWRKLAATPEIRERLFRVELERAKDVSELHKQDPGGFAEGLRKAREGARAWRDMAEAEEHERAREAWASCRELAESPDILSEFSRDLEACRVVGERTNGELLYLALVSRLLEKIVSVAVKGPSSGGKSYLVKLVMSFFLASAFCRFTAMSEKTLLYTEEPLSHRHIVLSEAAGLSGDFQEYVIRTLLSEGFLEYEFVEKTPEGLRPRRITKEGPTGFITTTTRDKLHAENETRYLSLTVTDTREQTRRVFRALADGDAEEPDRARWHALQAWLEAGERRVVIPFAGALAEKMGDVAVRLRRDFSVVLSLIKAHAILHQATRERDADGRIVATLADYSRVRGLVSGLIAEGVEATVPKTVRETVEAVGNVISGWDEDHATNKAVAEELKVDKAAASRRVRAAIGRGYLKNLEDRKGHPARLVLAESMPEDQEILPAAEELEGVDRLTVDRGGVCHPPPPSEARVGRGGSRTPPDDASTGQPREEFIL